MDCPTLLSHRFHGSMYTAWRISARRTLPAVRAAPATPHAQRRFWASKQADGDVLNILPSQSGACAQLKQRAGDDLRRSGLFIAVCVAAAGSLTLTALPSSGRGDAYHSSHARLALRYGSGGNTT